MVFVIYLRYLIGGAFVYSSIPKIAGLRFTTASGEFEPINSWIHFFETLYRTGIYWNFLGWMQLLAGLLLMTQRYATLGALGFLPISLNIFVITVSLDFNGTPYITGLILAANLFLLLWDIYKLRFLLEVDSGQDILIKSHHDSFMYHSFWTYLGVLMFCTTVYIKLIHQSSIIFWGLLCILEGLSGLAIFLVFRKTSTNTTPYNDKGIAQTPSR